jgi:hypothetical protein
MIYYRYAFHTQSIFNFGPLYLLTYKIISAHASK